MMVSRIWLDEGDAALNPSPYSSICLSFICN